MLPANTARVPMSKNWSLPYQANQQKGAAFPQEPFPDARHVLDSPEHKTKKSPCGFYQTGNYLVPHLWIYTK